MTLVNLNSGYAYDDLGLGRKIFYKMIPIPFLDLPNQLQERIKKIEDNE